MMQDARTGNLITAVNDPLTFHHRETFSQATRESFQQLIAEHPSSRRLSPREKDSIIEWLTTPSKKPSSQREFSRRHYARKTFYWDGEKRELFAINKSDIDNGRIVITEDLIPDVVEAVHNGNGHAGWDGTWKDISSSYHGILRSDVIYLLKRCLVCMHNPSKRPKNPTKFLAELEPVDSDVAGFLNPRELAYNALSSDSIRLEDQHNEDYS